MKRHIVILLLLTLCSLTGRAQQDFTQLDWNVLRIDSVLPRYSEVVPLETDYHLFKYYTRVRYPEWAPLTAAESAVAARFDDQLCDTLRINTFVGVSRGQGLIDLDFIPIIRRDGQYWKLLSGKFEIVPLLLSAPALRRARGTRADKDSTISSDRWAKSSVLAEGRWVKISLTDDGIYHLTNSQLRSMGFSNPQNIRVYGYGGHQQSELIQADTDWDDLSPVTLLPVADGYLFHANGLTYWHENSHTLNHYARTACYFVRPSSPARAPPTPSSPPSAPVSPTTHRNMRGIRAAGSSTRTTTTRPPTPARTSWTSPPTSPTPSRNSPSASPPATTRRPTSRPPSTAPL